MARYICTTMALLKPSSDILSTVKMELNKPFSPRYSEPSSRMNNPRVRKGKIIRISLLR